MAWRWVSASVIGTSHIRDGSRCQDAYAISELSDGYLFAVVSDGAGTAKYGAFGAWLICRFLSVKFRKWLQNNSKLPCDEELANWIDQLRKQLSVIATRRETTSRQFAATLAAIIIAPNEIVTLHIGDSAIVGRSNGQWDVLCLPENGEYASSTYFVTDYSAPNLNISRHQRKYDAFALFSDGVGDLALSYIEQSAYPRFLNPMLRPIDAALGNGRLIGLSEKLAAYLASPLVCERTDDDKTLILISEI